MSVKSAKGNNASRNNLKSSYKSGTEVGATMKSQSSITTNQKKGNQEEFKGIGERFIELQNAEKMLSGTHSSLSTNAMPAYKTASAQQ